MDLFRLTSLQGHLSLILKNRSLHRWRQRRQVAGHVEGAAADALRRGSGRRVPAWPPFRSRCGKPCERAALGWLFRSTFSSGVGLSIEWALSLPLPGQTGVCVFIVFSLCYIVPEGKGNILIFWLVFLILWSSATLPPSPPRVFPLENYGRFFFCCLNKN